MNRILMNSPVSLANLGRLTPLRATISICQTRSIHKSIILQNVPENKPKIQHTHTHDCSAPGHSHTHDCSAPGHTHSTIDTALQSLESSGSADHSHSHSLNPFGHSHSHAHTNELLTLNKSQLKNPGVRITWIGLFVNVGMVITKGIGGIIFHSQSLLADALHSVSDLISDFLTLGTVNVASKKPTPNFPLGYGKIETLGSLAVSGILLFAGLSVGWSSMVSIFEFVLPHNIYEMLSSINFGHDHSHKHSHDELADSHELIPATDINAAWLALGSIFIKEWLFNKTLKVGKETNSKVLIANAWHHRVDSLTSIVALATISGGYFLNINWLDSVGGLLVSTLIIRAGYQGVKTATLELIDKSLSVADERFIEIENKVNNILTKLISDNNSGMPYRVEKLVILPSGANLNLSVKLVAPRQKWENVLSVSELENVSKYLSTKLSNEDKYVKNVFVSFVEEKEKNTDTDVETHSVDHSHSHSDHNSHSHTHTKLQ